MSAGEVSLILFATFAILIALRIPVSFALGLACIPVFILDPRMTPIVLLQEMWKSYNAFILLAVPFFLLAANLMNASGITERLVNLAKATVGHLPGGLGHINVMVSMLFAGISGSSTADAAGIGSLMIPAMKKQGYDTSFSVAITACSSVMGVIIPPSILMVVWGGLMSVSIGGLFLAGVIPGLLMALFMMSTVYAYAKVRNYPVYQRASLKEFIQALGKAIFALVTPLLIVGGIVLGFFTPTEASVVAVIYSAFLGGVVYRKVGFPEFKKALFDSASLASVSLFCIGTASAFGWLLAYYRVPLELVDFLSAYGSGPIATGFIIAGSFLVIGMFIDAIPAIIILGTILMPLANSSGVHPIQFAIIGVISLAFGLVTPPYGLCLLISCTLGKIKIVHTIRDVAIILIPMFILLVLVILFPEMILFLPRWLTPEFL